MARDPFNTTDIADFTKRAKEAGASDDEINAFVGSKKAEIWAQEAKSSNPISDQITKSGGLLGGILGNILKPAERGGRYLLGAGAGLGLAGKAALGDREAGRALEQGNVPFVTRDEGRAMTTGSIGDQAKLSVKRGIDIGALIAPTGVGKSAFASEGLRGGLAASQEEGANPLSVATGAVTGGLAGGVLSNIPGILGKLKGKSANFVSDKAAESVLKSSPGAFKNASEAGLDPRKLFNKYNLKGGYEDFIGAVEEGGGGGQVGKLLGDAEGKIQNTIAKYGDRKINADAIIEDLTKQRNELAKLSTNKSKVAQLDEVIKDFSTQHGEGFSLADALDIKRAADSQFGRAVVEDEKGSIASQVNKVIANRLRKQLKSNFPQIEDALDTQHELLVLKELLGDARAKSSVGGSTLGKIDITRPGTVVDAIARRPEVTSRLGRAASGQSEGSRIPGALSSILTRGATIGAATNRDAIEQPVAPTTQLDSTQQIEEASPSQQEAPIITKEQLLQYKILDPKNKDLYQEIYDTVNDTKKKTSSAATIQIKGKANAGLRALDQIESLLSSDSGALFKSSLPFAPGARNYEAAVSSLTDALGGLRTGASVSKEQQAFYRNLLPKLGDDATTVRNKIENLRQELKDYASVSA